MRSLPGAVYGVGAVMPFVSGAFAAEGGGDAEILNFALTLEYLESEFYNAKGKTVGSEGPGPELREDVRRTGGRPRERAHGDDQATRLQASCEADLRVPRVERKARSSRSPRCSRTPGSAPTTAPAPRCSSKEVLAAAGSIVQVEARHAAAINLLIGASPTPNQGFDRPLTKQQVLVRAAPLIKK